MDSRDYGHQANLLFEVYELGGIESVVSFLQDTPETELQILTAYLIGHIKESQ